MSNVIAVFRSRSETLTFVNILRSYGVAVGTINTPRKANVSCGISAKFEERSLQIARDVLSRRNFQSFAGFFRLVNLGRDINLIKI